MELTTRPWITTGIVLAGASVVAVTPMAASMPPLQMPAVQLTASPVEPDPITAIEDVFNRAVLNGEDINDHFAPAPFPTLQQLTADPGSFDLAKVETAAITPFLPTGQGMNPPPAFLYPSLSPDLHVIAYQLLQQFFTDPVEKELLAFTASPLSSVLLGDLGPILDPGLALQNSISDALAAPDPTSAINDLLNIPANIADATLNGAFLDGTTPQIDLTPLLSLLPAGTLPAGLDISSIDLTLGGLLSPGGSLFNAIGVSLTFGTTPLSVVGHPVGPIGSAIELDQAIAAALGFNFNDIPPASAVAPFDDLLSSLVSSLGGDLPTTVSGGLSTEFGTLSTDILTGLASLF